MEENEKSAKIIDIQSLMSEDIGEEGGEREAFNGKPKEEKPDILGLNSDNEEEEEEISEGEEEKPDTEEAEEEEEKPTNTEEEGEEEGEEDPPKNPEATNYVNSLKNLFGDSITHVVQENEEGEEVEVALEDVELTQDLYEEIVKAKMEELQEEAKKGTISAEGISEFTRELIEIDRMGGDVNTLLKTKESYIDVLDKLDLSQEDDQKKAVYLRLKAEGSRSDEEIDILINGYKSKGTLKQKAERSEEEIRDAVNKQVEQAKEVARKEREERENLIKEYQKDLEKNLEQFDLDEKVKKKLAKLSVKRDDKERFEMDNLYFQMKRDPEKAAKLALFIFDSEEYNKQVSKEVKRETQLKGAGKISLIKKKTGSSGDEKRTTKKTDRIILDDLNT